MLENEKYYWENSSGIFIPKDELSDEYICNIVMKFGKMYLEQNGHELIVRRFEALNKQFKFFRLTRGLKKDE